MKKIITITILSILLFNCTNEPVTNLTQTEFQDVPEWSKRAIWYQIFPERFRNGDPTNDPTAEDIVGNFSSVIPENWQTTPWTQDWYKPDPYFEALHGEKMLSGYPIENFGHKAQLRRYGGDLQGVLDKVGYLKELGITAVYFNPLNDAPSLHKYDPRYWRHIDRNFGPNPKSDQEIIDQEVGDDPNTWQFTPADSLFLQVIKTFHENDIRLIMDYSWNHTGKNFWAIKDIEAKGAASKYADWYMVDTFDDPKTEANEFKVKTWFGVPSLPELKETVDHHASNVIKAYEGDLYSEAARQHIFNVTKRWLDPNGDGDPSDGVDGFRLDVAGEIGTDFWKAYRKEVRAVNPNAYLIGEIWWEEWPDKLLDPEPYLKGDIFDAVMNYRWYRAARHFFNQSPDAIAVSEFVDSLEAFRNDVRDQNSYAMMNLTASHDVPRFATSIFNKNKYKVGTNPSLENDYKIHKPNAKTYETMRLILVQQYTYIGAPHIWAGDEMGMWGSDDPNCRKPLIWKDYDFEPETHHPFNKEKLEDKVAFNEEWFDWYKKLIAIRKENPVLISGDIAYLLVNDSEEQLVYRRYDENNEVFVAFNASNSTKSFKIPIKGGVKYQDLLNKALGLSVKDDFISFELSGRSAAIIR